MKHVPSKKGCSNSVYSLGSHYQPGSQSPSDNQKLAEALRARLKYKHCLSSWEGDSKIDACPYHQGYINATSSNTRDKVWSLFEYHCLSEIEKYKSLAQCSKMEIRHREGESKKITLPLTTTVLHTALCQGPSALLRHQTPASGFPGSPVCTLTSHRSTGVQSCHIFPPLEHFY